MTTEFRIKFADKMDKPKCKESMRNIFSCKYCVIIVLAEKETTNHYQEIY